LGKLYLYVSHRDGTGKAVKTYIGTGQGADYGGRVLVRNKARREAERRSLRDAQAVLAGADALMAEFIAVAVLLTDACLLAEGFHRPNYGPWRRKRNGHGRHRAAPAAGGVGGDQSGGCKGQKR
jgi:hypothetical protein